jgi:hypothetical protein
MSDDRALLIRVLEEAYQRHAWHGPNLRSALRGLTPNQAFWRPDGERHSAWELMLHCAYWKHSVWRRLTGARRAPFSLQGRNFFAVTAPTARAWRDDLALLGESHTTLLAAVAKLPAATLAKKSRIVYGVAMHDVYHAGQIRLLRKLYGL